MEYDFRTKNISQSIVLHDHEGRHEGSHVAVEESPVTAREAVPWDPSLHVDGSAIHPGGQWQVVAAGRGPPGYDQLVAAW